MDVTVRNKVEEELNLTVHEEFVLWALCKLQGMSGPLTTCLLSLGYDIRSHVTIPD
jgi:hypothetical protein